MEFFAIQINENEIEFINESCRNTTLCRSFGSSLRPFLVPKTVKWLKGHDWKIVFSAIGIWHLRKAFLAPHQLQYREWFFKFALWTQRVHRRKFSVTDTHVWEAEIIILVNEAEVIYGLYWSTSVTHYLVHLPAGLRRRGPLVFWSMYGLERFGDWLMKLSQSSHDNKHVSIVQSYRWMELATFLRVDNPDLFSSLKDSAASMQPHMFCLSTHLHVSSWKLVGAKSRVIILEFPELVALEKIYSALYQPLGLASFRQSPGFTASKFERSALQVRGKLWTGRRYYRSYYEAGSEDQSQFSRGACLIRFINAASKVDHAVIRDVWKHQAFTVKGCPDHYFFHVELLAVEGPGPLDEFKFSSGRLPLPVARLTGKRILLSHLALLPDTFCMKADDDDPAMFYIIDLLS